MSRSLVFLVTITWILVHWTAPVAAQPPLDVQHFHGEVRIETTDAGEVLVAIDERRAGARSDGVTDRVFVFSQHKSVLSVSEWFEAASIRHREGELVISTQENRSFLTLSVRDDPPARGAAAVHDASAATSGTPSERLASNSLHLGGFGLSHFWGGFDSSVDYVASQGFLEALGWYEEPETSNSLPEEGPDQQTDSGCDAGGPGADRCSVSGCSGSPSGCTTTCSGQSATQYACCRCDDRTYAAKCNCIG